MAIKLDDEYIKKFISDDELRLFAPLVEAAHNTVMDGTGPGSDFLGWRDLPVNYDRSELEEIKLAAKKIQNQAEILVVIGIGGSYLGSRSVIELVKSQDYNFTPQGTPQILFAGNNLSSVKLRSVMQMCEGKDLAINVISKSGTTLEPALAFRVLREMMIEKYGKSEARERIYVTTDPSDGALRRLAKEEGYQAFNVPRDIGGRFSVLTPVGLLPIAVAGIDTEALLDGAAAAREDMAESDLTNNSANKYAALRNILYNKNYTNEMFVGFQPALSKFAEWWKQLHGESEGKNHGGINPQSVTYTTDLHSLGQYMQEGRRDIFETVINIEHPGEPIIIQEEVDDLDGLNYLTGKSLDYVNNAAMLGTIKAHVDSGVPNILINMPNTTEHEVGYLIYFFEKACAVSGYLAGINPFDQPGVESYKENMYKILGKK